jgi:hypothetical protein
METTSGFVAFPSGAPAPTEVGMLRADVVQEILARLARGEGVKRIARELGVDRKTVCVPQGRQPRGQALLPGPCLSAVALY